MTKYLFVTLLFILAPVGFSAEHPVQDNMIHSVMDGYGSFLETSATNGEQYANGFTFSGWFYIKSLPQYYESLVGYSWESFAIFSNSGTIQFAFLQQLADAPETPLNRWINLALSFDGITTTYYIDGVAFKADEYACCDSTVRFPDNEGEFFAVGNFDGFVKQFKIWDRHLTAAEILTEIERKDSASSNPVHQWLMDEGDGPTIADTGASANADLFNPGKVFWRSIHSPYEYLTEAYAKEYMAPILGAPVTGLADFDQDGRKEIFFHQGNSWDYPSDEPMVIFSIDTDLNITNVSESMIDGGLYYKNFPSGRDTIIQDLNDDGYDDVFYVNSSGHGFVISPELPALLLSEGNSGKLFPKENTILSEPCTLTAPLYEGQKPCEIAVSPGEGQVLYPDENALGYVSLNDGIGGHGGSAGDIDRDGDTDLFTAGPGGGSEEERRQKPVAPHFYINDGRGNLIANWQKVPHKAFTYYVEYYGAEIPEIQGANKDAHYSFGQLTDLDKDGFLDMVLVNCISPPQLYYPPSNPFDYEKDTPWLSIYELVAWGDESGFSEEYSILYADNLPIEITTQEIPPWSGYLCSNTPPFSIDFDMDGDMDLILARDKPVENEIGGTYIQFFRNEGDRTFIDKTSELFPQTYDQILIDVSNIDTKEVDVNNDGCPDVLRIFSVSWGRDLNREVSSALWLNNCAGYFTPVRDSYFGRMGTLLAMDVDQDGIEDYVTVLSDVDISGEYYGIGVLRHTGKATNFDYFIDTDRDGILDSDDGDDDGDGVQDIDDAFSKIASESVDTDSDGIGNNADPDDDNDGIMDSLDRQPLVSSNLCGGDNAILEFQTITSEVDCSATTSLTVESTVSVESTGDLLLISPSVGFHSGFNVKVGGILSVKSTSPLPSP